jgi:hypothetical protein
MCHHASCVKGQGGQCFLFLFGRGRCAMERVWRCGQLSRSQQQQKPEQTVEFSKISTRFLFLFKFLFFESQFRKFILAGPFLGARDRTIEKEGNACILTFGRGHAVIPATFVRTHSTNRHQRDAEAKRLRRRHKRQWTSSNLAPCAFATECNEHQCSPSHCQSGCSRFRL